MGKNLVRSDTKLPAGGGTPTEWRRPGPARAPSALLPLCPRAGWPARPAPHLPSPIPRPPGPPPLNQQLERKPAGLAQATSPLTGQAEPQGAPPCAATAWPADQDLARRPCKRPRPPSSALARPGQGASAAGRRWRVRSRHQWPRIKKDPAKAGSCRRQKPSPCMARTTNSAKPMAPGRPQAWALALMRRLSLRLKPKAMPAPSKGRGPGTLSWV